MHAIDPGTKIVRLTERYRLLELGEDEVRLSHIHAGSERVVTETRERFDAELAAGRAVVHPDCPHCGLPVDPEEAVDSRHYHCWFQGATVAERCEAEAERPSGNRMAAEALNADSDPTEYLLSVIGDPVRSFHDRCDAEDMLSGAVGTRTLIDAQVECPECGEGEVFDIDPGNGAVTCHCGHQMQPPD